jgi:hypothetical protein
VTAKISLQKQDKETKKAVPQGDATLEKAVYGLYAREDIVHPDGATGVIYKAGEQVATLTTDKNGQASVGWIISWQLLCKRDHSSNRLSGR